MDDLVHIIALPCGIEGDVFGPKDGGFLPCGEKRGFHILIGADNVNLFF
jgi:hypothetical protein